MSSSKSDTSTANNGLQKQSKPSKDASQSKFRQLFGFDLEDLTSWESFVRLSFRPTDPGSLAICRILFGLLMAIDIPQERGLGVAYSEWGDSTECRFPLFNFLEPLPIKWMYAVYWIMLSGAIGICLGLFFRLSCFLFVITYWYVFFLDKTSWNNHSYLYGLLGFQLMFMDANRYWSLDGLLNKNIRNAHIPLWNLGVIRAQIFFVYFCAGLKKLDYDWMFGYSMGQLNRHWVFDPFRYILTSEQIDLYIVHLGGLTLDLFIGFVYFFDVTRPFGFFFGSSFHLMNSQLFSIGMFPWAMLATQPLFCYPDWPRKLFRRFPTFLQNSILPLDTPIQSSPKCLYTKEEVKPEENAGGDDNSKGKAMKSKAILHSRPQKYHKMVVVCVLLYVGTQTFLPYSHFITKGYNNWTNGLYGYSWDMMVHSWSTQHMRLTYIDKTTGEQGYLNPKVFSSSRRWASHADMVVQYAYCVAERLKEFNMTNVALHFDVWKSLNQRFQQRMFDPRVDILSAPWHPLQATPWLMPLLVDLSNWRSKLEEITVNVFSSTNDTDVVFVADFPGLRLENYIQPDLGNTSVHVLNGEVMVEIVEEHKNYTLKEGQKMQVPAGQFHNVHTVSSTPSCYMYLFVNTTEQAIMRDLRIIDDKMKEENKTVEQFEYIVSKTNLTTLSNKTLEKYRNMLKERDEKQVKTKKTFLERQKKFWLRKYMLLKESYVMSKIAFNSIRTGRKMSDVMEEYQDELHNFMDMFPADDGTDDDDDEEEYGDDQDDDINNSDNTGTKTTSSGN